MRSLFWCFLFSISLTAQESPRLFLNAQLQACQAAINRALSSLKIPTPSFPQLATLSVPSRAYPYLLGCGGIAGACVALWSFVRTKYQSHTAPQLTLGAWIAEMEQQSAQVNELISPELQRSVSTFLAVNLHNYATLKKAVSSDVLKNSYDSIKNDNLYKLLPILESDCLKKNDGTLYSVLIEPSEDIIGSQRREFLIKNGRCLETHIYKKRATPDNAFGIQGIYETACYYPKNTSDIDSECAQCLIKANLLIETKRRYELFHAEWQQQKNTTVSPQTPPWDAQLYTIVLAELEKHRCKGSLDKKGYCIRTVHCEARDIVAAFKEYEFWMQAENQHAMQTCHSLETIAKAKEQARALFSSKIAHTPFDFEQLNEMKKKIVARAHA